MNLTSTSHGRPHLGLFFFSAPEIEFINSLKIRNKMLYCLLNGNIIILRAPPLWLIGACLVLAPFHPTWSVGPWEMTEEIFFCDKVTLELCPLCWSALRANGNNLGEKNKTKNPEKLRNWIWWALGLPVHPAALHIWLCWILHQPGLVQVVLDVSVQCGLDVKSKHGSTMSFLCPPDLVSY